MAGEQGCALVGFDLGANKVAAPLMRHGNDCGHGRGFLQAMFSYSETSVGREMSV